MTPCPSGLGNSSHLTPESLSHLEVSDTAHKTSLTFHAIYGAEGTPRPVWAGRTLGSLLPCFLTGELGSPTLLAHLHVHQLGNTSILWRSEDNI